MARDPQPEEAQRDEKVDCPGRRAEHPDGAEDPSPGLAATLFEEACGGRAFGTIQGVFPSEVAAVGYCAQAVFEELRVRGYTGGYDTVRRFVGPLREEANLEETVRFETPPGRHYGKKEIMLSYS